MFHIILIIFFSKFHRTYFFLALRLWCTLRCDFLDSRILKYAAEVHLWASSCMILISLDCLIKKHDRESFMNFQWEKWRDPIEETYWLSERQISFQHRRNGQWKHRKETEASENWKSILLRNGVRLPFPISSAVLWGLTYTTSAEVSLTEKQVEATAEVGRTNCANDSFSCLVCEKSVFTFW